MSHDWDCPDPWRARSDARHDAESGWNRHRYSECEEASKAYEREYRQEQYRIEERAEEERYQARRAEMRRQEEYQQEQYEQEYYQEQERRRYEAAQEAEFIDAMIAQEMDEGRVNRDAECAP